MGELSTVSLDPPEGMDEETARVWREVVASHGKRAHLIVGPDLEAFCGQVAILRDAQKRIMSEGLVIEDGRRQIIPHPALAVARNAQVEIRKSAAKFEPPTATPRRRSGPMVDATRRTVKASPHLADEKYAGAVDALMTLAWLIDESQRAGIDALMKAAFGPIPSYLKAAAELQVTPASVPTVKVVAGEGESAAASKLSKMGWSAVNGRAG